MNDKSVIALAFLLLVFLCALAAAFQTVTGTAIVADQEGFKAGRPSDFAEATAKARAADLARTATVQALSATATAQAQVAAATATAVPYQASRAASSAAAEIANRYTGSIALCGGALVALWLGLAVVAVVRTRSRIVPRGADGQLPGILIGQTITDPARQVGPAVTVPQGPGFLWNVARAIRYARTGELWPLPESRAQLTDGNADAEHLLEAARIAGMVGVASATFRPDNAERGRQAKLELLHKRDGPSGLLGATTSPPQTRVVVTGDSAIEAIARQLGDKLPVFALPVSSAPDAPETHPAAGAQMLEGKTE